MNKEIPWIRIFAEGGAIVVSILLAFAIDAWWEDRRDASRQRTQLESLLGETAEAGQLLERQLGILENSLSGTLNIIQSMGPDASTADVQAVKNSIRTSFNIGVLTPPQSVLQEVLATQGAGRFPDLDLYSNLQRWSSLMSDIENDARLLDRNREEDFLQALIRLEIPLSNLLRSGDFFGDRANGFNVDPTKMLRDPAIDTVFAMRVIRFRVLIESHAEAIGIAEELRAELEQILQD